MARLLETRDAKGQGPSTIVTIHTVITVIMESSRIILLVAINCDYDPYHDYGCRHLTQVVCDLGALSSAVASYQGGGTHAQHLEKKYTMTMNCQEGIVVLKGHPAYPLSCITNAPNLFWHVCSPTF